MKLIFLDVDGTIIPFGHNAPSASTIQAIKKAQKNGHKVYLNTGRCRTEINQELERIGFDGIICSNSLYIEENNKTLYQKDMEITFVQELIEWLTENEVGFFLEGQKSVKAGSMFFPQLEKIYGNKIIEKLKKGFPVIQENKITFEDVAKINFILRPGIFEKVKEKFGSRAQINSWSLFGKDRGMGEITVLEASKAYGVDFIAKKHEVPIEDTLAFGDTAGDLSMIKFCKTGVAMGNAEDILKEAANYITDSVENDGIAKAFEKFSLLG